MNILIKDLEGNPVNDLREKLRIDSNPIAEINAFLLDPSNEIINQLLEVIHKYGGVAEINRKHADAGKVENLMARLEAARSPYMKDLSWLIEQRDKRAFISMKDYIKQVTGGKGDAAALNQKNAVTLEISALQYFPWLITQAKRCIAKGELMPGRVIRVRTMVEQEADNGDILAVAAAMRIIGASYVETLDTKGTDGSNVHLGGPETITGYFGGIGQPNHYPIQWVDEYLKYHTTYGVRQVLNINPGTVLVGYLLHKLGVDNEFKISVFMGNDNPYTILWTLLAARLFSREDGTCPLVGFNFSNSVSNATIEVCAQVRKGLDLEKVVRFEHHITEAWKSVVRQPYLRRDELVDIAARVPNISAKHEGGDPATEETREHPSDILDYFLPKADVEAQGLMPALLRNYMDKHDALNATARALTEHGIAVAAAPALHG
jgi:hypothetical protein